MPTATSTVTKSAYSTRVLSKGTIPVPSLQTTHATLSKLYNRAARAFLLRDIPLTHSLLESAFSLISAPIIVPDSLADSRRKWDILRITLETTVYSSPPSSHDELPEPLRTNLLESPQALITTLHARSLALFTPSHGVSQKSTPNAAYLPPQVLITLVYSSLKVDCPSVGREMIEDWLGSRNLSSPASQLLGSPGDMERDGYEKVLELYCLRILPKLEQWDYAREFLDYEEELPVKLREEYKESLKSLHAEATPPPRMSQNTFPSPSFGTTPRSDSPSPSSSSSSSSLSTTSTHTIVPGTHRTTRSPRALTALTSLIPASTSTTSLSSDTTATPRQQLGKSGRPTVTTGTTNSSSTSHAHNPLFVSRSHPQTEAMRPTNPSTYALIRASLAPYLTMSNLSTFLLLFVIFPLISVLFRTRRRRQQMLSGGTSGPGQSSNAEIVRRRLHISGPGNEAGIFGRAWGEVTRVLGDTVRMAGSGLV